jgi:molybdate transport system regulatory protein
MTTRITLRLDFDDSRRLGPGKIALLEAIRQHGSIAGAGRDFGMSYRRAWLLVDELNKMFVSPLVEAHGGGRNGGGAVLTEAGERVVALYRQAERKISRSAAREIEKIEQALALAGSAQE